MTVSLVQNFFKQTVTTPWTTGTGNFYVSQKPNVTSGFLVISPNSESLREIVSFSAVGTDGGGDYVTVSARGLGGTTEQAHGAGEKVYMNITAQHIEQIKQAIEDINNAGALNASTTVKGVARLSASPNVVLGNPTITIASPAVVTLTAHGLTENDEVQFTTTIALPTGITPAAKYYVIGTGLTANTFQFSDTFGGAAVNTSGSQSGVHTLTKVTPVAVSPNDARIPSTDIAAALAGGGDFGTPNAGNKFLTETFVTNRQKFEVFTANGTYTKPTNAKLVEVYVIGGGGGGGGGAIHSSTVGGGGGGQGGGISHAVFNAASLAATVAVTIGAGGASGAGKTVGTTGNGSAGGQGGTSSFGTHLTATGGNGGGGGQTGLAGTAGSGAGIGNLANGSNGGAGGYGNQTGVNGVDANTFAPTGGGGGGGTDGTTGLQGGVGGARTVGVVLAGGAAGAANSGVGGNGNSFSAVDPIGGTGAGGGGGDSGDNAAGGNGGTGGAYGGGGGGAGPSGNTAFAGGNGGVGGAGVVVVITYM